MSNILHITIAQINPIVGNLSYNADKIRAVWSDGPQKTDLVVLPELALCGYPPEDLVLKPSFLDEIDRLVHRFAAESAGYQSALLLTAPWRDGGKIYNAAHLLAEGRIQATVCKHHLPTYGVFDEGRVFVPGPLPEPVAFRGHRLGIMVCEDMWHADVAAHLRRQGAELLIVPNASPYDQTKHDMRLALARARVHETGLPLLYVNQCGGQDELVFDGASFIISEGGRLLLQADEFTEATHHTAWEKTANSHWLCTADDIHDRPEPLASVYRALTTGLRDYVTKNGFPGVLIGLSGGIDSAISAAIAVDALGKDAVQCVMMPSRFTSKDSLEDAEACAKMLGVLYDVIPIEQPVETFNRLLGPHIPPAAPSAAYENIQSRTRGLILMGLSNAGGRMVLSTGNKSEMAVGYATLYGDMCGGFNVLKDVYKTLVYDLSRYRNENRPAYVLGPHGAVMPDRILTKAPTAELKAGQTDQDTLPPYETLDAILRGLIERDLSVDALVGEGHDRATVGKVSQMLDNAEYKRRQAPPGVKITGRSFGRERRYPITSGYRE